MDYEKKYKEALDRARQFSEHPLQEDSSNIVEYIFPELRESKDEKIRQKFIKLVKMSNEVGGFALHKWEAYCSDDVCKLLKEKGFNERTICYYFLNGEIRQSMADAPWNNGVMEPIMICAPTHQMALQWLREVHGIFIAINNDDLDFNWQCYDLINRESTLDPKILSESYAGYKTYEETIEAALKYTLENLI